MPKVKAGSKADKNKDRPIHPYSRKAKKLGKQAQHFRKVDATKNARMIKLEMLAEKLLWFQNAIDDREKFSPEDLVRLVLLYMDRFEDELEQINIVHKVGKRQTQNRQHASREAAIQITKENERNQYASSGIEVPNIVNKKHLDNFRNWGGELNLIQNLKLIKVSVRGVQGMGASRVETSAGVLSNDDRSAVLDVNENLDDDNNDEDEYLENDDDENLDDFNDEQEDELLQ